MILLNFGNLLLAFLDNGTDCTVPTTCGTAFITAKAGQACKNAPRCLCGTLGVVLGQGCGRIQNNWRSGPASAGAFAPIDLSKEPPHFRCLRSKVAGAVEPAKDHGTLDQGFLDLLHARQLELCFRRNAREGKRRDVIQISSDLARQVFKLLSKIGRRNGLGQSMAMRVLAGPFLSRS